MKDEYKINPNKISVIYNGLTDCYHNPDKTGLRRKYRIPDIPIFLFAGRLNDMKGLSYLLRAFKIVTTQQKCHLIIVGSGHFDTFVKECEDIWMQVTWTGMISKDKLFDLYTIADVGMMPSFTEQCSYVAIEMMMHGLPIIGSDSTGLSEMIVDEETGLHVPVNEYDDKIEIEASLLADKMLYLLHHPIERQRMGQNARKRYEEIYSEEVFRNNMLDFYQSLF